MELLIAVAFLTMAPVELYKAIKIRLFLSKKTKLPTQPQLRAAFPFRLTLLLMDFGHVKSEILAQLVSMQLKLGFLSRIIYAHWAKTSDMVSLIKTWLTY